MVNIFSGNREKKIPKTFKDCYKIDNVTKNLWIWCERLEKWGFIFCLILGIIGIISIVSEGIEMAELIDELNIDTKEIESTAAELGIEIKSVFEVVFEGILQWSFYCFLEYCTYHVLALLIGSLASIVQHTKISANITLYNSAKAEGITDDYEEECEKTIKETIKKSPSSIKTNNIPTGFKKCNYCKELSPIDTKRCSCGCLSFEMSNSENEMSNDEYLKKLEKVTLCAKCGADISNDDNTCHVCGKKI